MDEGRVPTGYLIMTVQSSLEELCNIYDSVGRLPATTGYDQDTIDKERLASLRQEMKQAGIEKR
ncbi:hypothetical protein NC653_011544 [Populus alba x Populus x berolinensis]|uniref:Uncharacterized protein n=1 Tax=Populus alba x Populus x berolinensis TaxID=444605 RepID=A0AAD6R2D8_9ROSI|nr:hypothetical protein NC653_011544 [Populus alba x Populus x berolinensis]